MQSLSAFFEDNKLLAVAAAVAAFVVLVIVVFVLYRLLFGRRLRAAANGRSRQPRLGIVDAYDLDRQRQLVLVRRDNVEHLIMIGGPTDVVIESSIIRAQAAPMAREKDGGGPMMGSATGPALAPAAPQPTPSPPAPLAAGGRTEPSIGAPAPARTEPPLGIAMASPAIDRAPADRGPSSPIAVPDPAAPAGPPPQQPTRMPPRSAPLPPRPAPSGGVPPASGAVAPAGAPTPAGALPPTDRPPPARTPLPPRPPITRPPLPPRPNLASTLPPRPPRPLPGRPDAPRPGAPADEATGIAPATAGAQTSTALEDMELRAGREPEPAPPAPEPVAAPPKTVETLESLEEEMAKLLGRPPPRRDG